MESKGDTDRRINQMVAFIRQEARDKAEEIQVRAKEECNVEVLKMVDKEKAKLREQFKQQDKRVEIEGKIQRQKLVDKYRMELLKSQDAKKVQLQEECGKALGNVTKDAGRYKAFLKNAMIQAFIKIWDEAEVQVSCRKEDAKLVQSLMDEALKNVVSRAKNECAEELSMKATFNKTPIRCLGGVLVTARGGRVVCDNTLDARLTIVMKNELPYVRNHLFSGGRLVPKK